MTKNFIITMLVWLAVGIAGRAGIFTWTQISSGNASGSWAAQTNWSGGTLPTTSGDTADFTTVNPTTNSTVMLDGNQTINNLIFNFPNIAAPASWTVAAGNPSTSTLTLAGTSPTVNVSGAAAGNGGYLTINANLAGSAGFTETGGGFLALNGTNTISGASALNGGVLVLKGPLNGSGSFAVNSGGWLQVNSTVNSAIPVTVNSGSLLSGTGSVAGYLIVNNGGTLAPSSGSGPFTCGRLVSYAGANFNFALGATNNTNNTLIAVGNGLTLAGTLNITDIGGFGPGVYTGFQYSGSLRYNGLTNGTIAGGRTVVMDTTSTPGYVLFDVLNGTLNPAAGQNLPMDLASPLPLGWVQVLGATTYDVYLGTVSNVVASATTNTAGIYQGRTNVLTINIAGLQPNTTYYWRVDGVATNGTPNTGTVYSFTTGAAMVDLMEDTWVASDALGRTLPGLADCGSPRTNRVVGMFYFLWQSSVGNFGSGNIWDISSYLSTNPFANPHNPWASNPIMQMVSDYYWWGQPALGYYNPSDPWVLRRHIALLSHAGVDVLIFDYSNGEYYDAQLTALCDMIEQMRFEGYKINLKITFLTQNGNTGLGGTTVTHLYNTLYGAGKYPDLWFYWQGKPLILGNINGGGGNDIVPSSAVQNFFTWRTSAGNAGGSNTICWLYPSSPQQYGYSSAPDHPESTPVSCGGGCPMNIGRSYANNAEPDHNGYDLPVTGTQGLGLQFRQQMFFGLKYDPLFMYVTGWNEWIAGPLYSPAACSASFLGDCCPAGGFYFWDEYNQEFSRDLEPMSGGHTDNYYYQLVAQDRLRKGVRPVPVASAPQTINPAGGFAQWTNVGPAYYDPVNDTIWRNYPGASAAQMGTYTNTTGRNDLTVMKVARDAKNFYFFAQCNSNITSYTGSNWMVLFIDADQNHQTGWEGYDYAVNLGGVSSNTTTLYQNTTTTDAWNWTTLRSDIAYTIAGNQLMLTIPRASLGLGADPVQFDFKWADNFQTNDIADFGVDGDTAPDRRFNYRYITTSNAEVTLLSDDFENGEQSVWGVTWANGSLWSLTTNSSYSGNTCVVGSSTPSGQNNLITNPNFSANAAGYTNWPGYNDNGGNPAAPIGWSVSAGLAGVNGTDTASIAFGPGTLPSGDWAFIQDAGTMTQSQPALIPRHNYQLTFQAAGRAGNSASFVVTIGDNVANYVTSGTNVANNAAFQSYSYNFTAPATFSGTPFIQLQNVTPSGDNTADFTAISLVDVTSANLVANGDFSANAANYGSWPGNNGEVGNPVAPTGWTAPGNSGVNGTGTGGGGFAPYGPTWIPVGDFAFIQGAGTMTQFLPALTPGQNYQLTFQAASRSGESASFVVTIGDSATTYVSSGTNVADNSIFQSYSYNFTAPATFSGVPFIQLQKPTSSGDTVDFTAISLSPTSPSSLIARVSTAGYGSFRLNFHYKLTNVLNAQTLQISYLATNGWVPIRQLSRDEYYPVNQSWSYDELQSVWLNFTDTRYNIGPDALFFSTNFAFRIDASALTASNQQVFIDAVNLAADTQMPAAISAQTWQTQDIGNAGNAGNVSTNGATFTVSGSGLDIWNLGDAFRFLYQTRTGDGTLTARVTGITPTDPWAKAGVMIRELLDSGARNATMLLSASNGVSFQQRTTALAATTAAIVGPSVTPLNTVSIVSRVQGQITKVNYQEGQLVHAGDPLVEIDPGPNQAALTQAEGQLARDTAQLEDARLDLERYQEAFASNAIPKQQLDTQVAAVHQDEGTVKLDQGLLDNAKVQLAYCHITSPISGRVGLRLVDSGNIVQANSTNPLLVITELQPIAVIFNVAEDDLPQIQKQLTAGNTLAVDAFDRAQTKKLATGTLLTVDNQIDPTTGTVKLKAVFTNADETLFPNQFVNARLLVDTIEDATLLPNTVIQRNADSAFVYLIKPDKTGTNQTVAMQTITIDTTDGNVSAVDGIDPDTVVAADNFNKLTDGAKVTLRSANGGGAGKGGWHKKDSQ